MPPRSAAPPTGSCRRLTRVAAAFGVVLAALALGACDAEELADPGHLGELACPDTLDVGRVPFGSTGSAALRLRNTGTTRVTVSSFHFAGANAPSFAVASDAPVRIEPGGTAEVDVLFHANVDGEAHAELLFAADADSSGGVAVRATTLRPALVISDDHVDFGRVAVFDTVEYPIHLENRGEAVVRFGRVQGGHWLEDGPAIDGDEDCGATLAFAPQDAPHTEIAAGASLDLVVSVTPASIDPIRVYVVFETDDPALPQVEIPVSARPYWAEFEVGPERLWVNCAVGDTQQLSFYVRPTNCEYGSSSSVRIDSIAFTGPAPQFTLEPPAVPLLLDCDEATQFVVTFRPDGKVANVEATIEVRGGSGQTRRVTAVGAALPCLAGSATAVDLGSVPVGCTRRELVTLASYCSAGVEIESMAAPDSDVLHIAYAPATPLSLSSFSLLPVLVSFEPTMTGYFAGTLTFATTGFEAVTFLLSGTGTLRTVVDTLALPHAPAVDILLVVDATASMEDDAPAVARQLDAFFAALLASPIDFRLAVADSEGYGLRPRDGSRPGVVSRATADALAVMRQNATVPTSATAKHSLVDTAITTFPGTASALVRPEALLVIIAISDGFDTSEYSRATDDFVDYFARRKGSTDQRSRVEFDAIAPVLPAPIAGCAYDAPQPGADTGRLRDLAIATSGVSADICSNWGRALADRVNTAWAAHAIPLSAVPQDASPDGMSVAVNGSPLAPGDGVHAGFSYDARGNWVRVADPEAGGSGQIAVSYPKRCSDD